METQEKIVKGTVGYVADPLSYVVRKVTVKQVRRGGENLYCDNLTFEIAADRFHLTADKAAQELRKLIARNIATTKKTLADLEAVQKFSTVAYIIQNGLFSQEVVKL